MKTLAVVLAVAAVLPIVTASPSRAAATGALEFRAALDMTSRDAPCPAELPTSIICHPRTGEGLVAGLGRVSETYSYNVTFAAECFGGVKILGYPAVFDVAGKGEIHLAVAERQGCLSELAGLTATQAFTVTGGTGIYKGASGNGQIQRAASFTATGGAAGVDTWIGTLNVPGLEFDATVPTITGATSETIRIPRRAKSVRVTYTVTATDKRRRLGAGDVQARLGSTFPPRTNDREVLRHGREREHRDQDFRDRHQSPTMNYT